MLMKPLLFTALNSFLKAGDGEERAADGGQFPVHTFTVYFSMTKMCTQSF